MKKLRRNIRVLALAVLVLFMSLCGYFTYSVYFYGGRWFASANNPRLTSQKSAVIMGNVYDRNGVLLATTKADGTRQYPPYVDIRNAVSHTLGDSRGIVSNGVETFMASYLLGFKSSVWDRLQNLLSGEKARGDDVTLTIDAELSEYASSLLRRHTGGAIVLYNYKTGEILCSTSYPDFDPRNMSATLNSGEDNGALMNRATQGLYPPGSIFKIITLASALENLPDVQLRQYLCEGTLTVQKTVVTEASQAVHGSQTLKQAFAKSCNTTFANLALELGYSRLSQTAENFGFGDNFLFQDLVLYNSQFPTTDQSRDDLAWAGIGQGRVLVTPLHMAMVAGAIANDGVMMEPRLLLSAVSSSGQSRAITPQRTYRRVTSSAVAEMVGEYMLECVQSGTGTQAQISGYAVAGKTGSAESSDDKSVKTHAWFVGYVDSEEHPLAIAVIIERGGSGGSIAAPIAQRILARAIKLGY